MIDRATVSVVVAVPPARAFAAFTAEIDLWWRQGLAYRVAGRAPGKIAFEPKLGGRLFETYQSKQGERVHETGRITTWDPPHRLAFEWRGANFAPGEVTHVDVAFTPTERGTRLELVHSGFAALRPGHPVTHGDPPDVFMARIGRWWGDLLTSLRVHVL